MLFRSDNETVDIVLYGKNNEGDTTTTKTYTFRKLAAPYIDGETTVYFDNSEYNWDKINVYAYYRDNSGNVINNGDWPGYEMTDIGGNMYGYVVNPDWDYSTAYIIFNNGNGTQFPSEVGYEIKKGESKIFNRISIRWRSS